MARSTTERLLADLNRIRGKSYPDIGYSYFADVKGDGTHNPRVYSIVNADGGVTFSDLNAATARQRCDKIRAAIEAANRERYGVTLAHDPSRPWF